MLCDYESSVHSSDDGNLEDVRKHTKAASMHKSGTNSAVKRGLASGFESPKSSPTTMSRLPASYAIDGKCRSSSRERSPSHRHRKKSHVSRSDGRSSRKHHVSSSKHKRSSRHSKHKHSSKKRHYRDSHCRDRHHHYRRKHRRRSSTSTSSSSSESSHESRSHRRTSLDDKNSSQTLSTNPKDTPVCQTKTESLTTVNTTLVLSTTVAVTSMSNPSVIPSQGPVNPTVQRLTAQDILDKIQKHQQEQAKAQALAAAAAANLPKYYNPTTVNAMKLAEQQQKRKLLWSKKDSGSTSTDSKTLWTTTSLIAGKGDSAAAAKFRKLMGIHDSSDEVVDGSQTHVNETEALRRAEAQAELFRRLEHEYEMSRTITHTQRGAGLGFSSAGHVDYSAYSAMQTDKDKNPNL